MGDRGLYHFIVVGAGIAGIAVSELLQRSGRRVLLLEAKDKVGSEATAHQQGWFHTGSLYAALPNNSFFRVLIGNLDDLFGYYSSFENMNMRLGKNIYTSRANGWFSNTTNFFAFVSPREPEVPIPLKPLWWLAIRRAQRRIAWFENLDFSSELSRQIKWFEKSGPVDFVTRWGNLGFELGNLSCVLKSRDRTMDSYLIVSDLLRSFLGSGGEIRLNSRVKTIGRNTVVTESGESYRANHIVVTSGHFCSVLTGVPTRILASPIVVVFPALTTINFVRMTPMISESVNHIFHRIGELEYSVIGNAVHFDYNKLKNDDKFIRESDQAILKRVAAIFPHAGDCFKYSIYHGVKTEVVNSGQLRNYQYHIIDTDNCTVALPGKFTLGFSLAVNLCRHFGIEPLRDIAYLAPQEAVSGILSKQKHLELVMEINKSALKVPAAT